jgi:diguanylate cyclase (GGDEF)-like protein/PAS domain S-box-containing protein
MKARIKQWFAPPVFEGDEEKTRRASFLNVSIHSLMVLLLLTLASMLVGGSMPVNVVASSLLALAIMVFLRHWLHRGKVALVGFVLLAVGFSFSTFTLVNIGTIRAPAATVYLLLIVLAGVLFEVRGIVVSTIFSSLLVGGIVLAENAGLLPIPNYSVTITQWITYTVLFATIGWMAFFARRSMQQSLEQAKGEIKAREQAEEQLRKLTRAVEQSPASIVITDLNGKIEYVNPRFTQVTGYTFEEAQGNNPRILKTDLTPIETHIKMWQTLQAGNEWRGEFINRKKNGELYYESAVISPISDQNGIPTHYLAVKEDVTERRQAENALQKTNEQLHQQNEYLSVLHQVTLDLLYHRNVDELLQTIVDRAVILLDAPFGELMLEKDGELVVQTFTQNQGALKGDRVRRDTAKLSWTAFDTKKPAVLDDYSTYPDRRDVYAETTLHAVADFPVLVRDKCIGVLAMGRSQAGYVFNETQIKNGMLFAQLVALVLDNAQLFSAAEYEISERKQAEDALQKANEQLRADMEKIEQLKGELREQAIRDPLTGLFNRRYLNETMAREIARAERENGPVSVIISDIDHFKTINDTYGHSIGDKFLVEIASLMKNHARNSDIVCRFGGEELLLVLPGTLLDVAEKRAEELRQKCAELIIQHEGKDLKVTMSFGVATYPTHGKDAKEIIINADKALYQSKNNGRNQVTVWSRDKGLVE